MSEAHPECVDGEVPRCLARHELDFLRYFVAELVELAGLSARLGEPGVVLGPAEEVRHGDLCELNEALSVFGPCRWWEPARGDFREYPPGEGEGSA